MCVSLQMLRIRGRSDRSNTNKSISRLKFHQHESETVSIIKCYTCGTMAEEYFGNKFEEEWKPIKWKHNSNNSICLWTRRIGYYYSMDTKQKKLVSIVWMVYGCMCEFSFYLHIPYLFPQFIVHHRWFIVNDFDQHHKLKTTKYTLHTISSFASHILHIWQCTWLRAPDPGSYTEYIKSKS